MAFEHLQAILFDVFGTVVDWRSGVAREAASFLATYGPDVDAFAFADAWRQLYEPGMAEMREGRRDFVPLDVLHRESLDTVLRRFGIDPDAVPAAALEALNLSWHRLDPWPDAVAGLTRLKTRYIIAPHSNGNIRLMLDMAKRAGLPWDAILGAETAQAYKPAPQAYHRQAAMLMLPPEQICMAAAHNGDLAAARACGFCTAFIPRPLEWGPGQTSDLAPTADWDLVAPDIETLAARLGT